MTNCLICKHGLADYVDLANDNELPKVGPIRIPPKDILRRQSSLNRLAMAYRAKEIPRRKILDFVSEHVTVYHGTFLFNGHVVILDDVDDLFDLDASERWLSDFLRFAVHPPRQQAQDRVAVRLALLWAALAVHNPVQAALVIR